MLQNQKLDYSRLIISFSAILAFILLFLELLILTPRPWPYTDGGGWERISLYQSIFWTQYIAHCQFFKPTVFGLLIWKYWGLGLAVFLSQFNYFSKKKPASNFKIPINVGYAFSLALIPQVALYFLYAFRFQKLYYHGLLNPLFTPHYLVISSLGLIIFPLITFLAAFGSLRSKDISYFFGLFVWVLFDIFISLILLNFLLWGCGG